MNIIEIPKRYIEGFKLLASLDDSGFKSYKEALSILNKDLDTNVINSLDNAFDNLNQSNERRIFQAILSVFYVTLNTDGVDEEFLEGFKNGYIEQTGSVEEAEILKDRLASVIEENPGIRCAVKAVGLIREAEHLYRESRILTDLRPIFKNTEPKVDQDFAVILHRLKISRDDGDGYKEIFFSMTRKQLEELNEVIERALGKDKSLRETCNFRIIE